MNIKIEKKQKNKKIFLNKKST